MTQESKTETSYRGGGIFSLIANDKPGRYEESYVDPAIRMKQIEISNKMLQDSMVADARREKIRLRLQKKLKKR
jgi:hypothetical protein